MPLPISKKKLIEQKLRLIKSGEQGEKDAAYFINFDLAKSENWAVIHDLRIEDDGRVAQIDHLLINRLFDIYVLESKHFSNGVKITSDGEFLIIRDNKYLSTESPIEQNKRHIIVLKQIIEKQDIMPKRLGISIKPAFYNYVLISPKSRVIRPSSDVFDTKNVIKADTLRNAIDKRVDKASTISTLGAVTKFSSTETLMQIARSLAALHKPLRIDYRKRFGIIEMGTKPNPEKPVAAKKPLRHYCDNCKKPITKKAAQFCLSNGQRFGTNVYCINCQNSFPRK